MPAHSAPNIRTNMLEARWQEYCERGTLDHFVEFALTLSELIEQFEQLKLPELVRLCEGLENTALALFGDHSTHPIAAHDASTMSRQIDILLQAIETAQPRQQRETKKTKPADLESPPATEWAKPHDVWVVADEDHPWVAGLTEQFAFFGFHISLFNWRSKIPQDTSPLVILFIPPPKGYQAAQVKLIKRARAEHQTSQLFCLSVPKSLETMVALLRAGVDVTIQPDQEIATVLAHVLDLIHTREQDPFRVLLVEDSLTAIAVIQKALKQHGIDYHSISNPQKLLAAVEMYRPDLVLMDMYMPHCTGVEATRVLRQLPSARSLPVVYLSSEQDLGLQIEALRLGGDQFLTKPCNPLLLSAVVKTKIERYRDMQRTSMHDGLTGLLNHSAVKARLSQLVYTMNPERDHLCVAMLDIDHFKSVNDTYGHPVGDQVIRSLAWLLKGRMRSTDIIGRYGGEEFLVVLREADMEAAYAVLDLARRDFSTMPHAHAGGTLRATFSAGISSYPACAAVNELIQSADDALLSAKRNGRNRIERAS